jgi:membrane protease YdiL (CAAX protease family)
VKELFLNKYGRVRSGWRASSYLFTFLILALAPVGFVLMMVADLPVSESTFAALRLMAPSLVYAAVAILLGWLYGRTLEALPFRALGVALVKGGLRHLLLGLTIGAIAFLIAIIFAAASGSLSFEMNRISAGGDIFRTLAIMLLVFAVSAVAEESLCRGYMLQTFARAKLWWLGALLTSLFFSAGHGANPNESNLSALNTLIAGIWFAVAWLRSRDLWFPFGMHLMWNWLQGPVFGISVSGIKDVAADPLLRAVDRGPDAITGGAYGIEGGIACTIALVVGIALTWYLPGITPDPELLDLTSHESPTTR